jgi:hypothetical protein
MKRNILFFLIFCLAVFSFYGQDIIENPEKPTSSKAGRVLQLKKEFLITDESGEFYFKYPIHLRIDSMGQIFVLDENQILKFSPDGKFLKNLYKKGQGPGEISTRFHSALSYIIDKGEIHLYDRGANKIIRMDGEGNLIDEVKLMGDPLSRLGGFRGDEYIFIDEEGTGPGLGFHDADMDVILVSKNGSSKRKIMGFPKKLYSEKNFGMDWARFFSVFEDKTQRLFVSHTAEYKIVLADLKREEIIRTFNRKYLHRVKYVVPDGLKDFYEQMKPPEKKYENDILGLFLDSNMLWVKTSTKHKSKGILFDVFNDKGQYIDNFYIQIDGELLAVSEDSLFFREKNEDETICLVKYDILK